MALKKVLLCKGVSSTGSVHQLEVEPLLLKPTVYKFTILGPSGKRHASVILTQGDKAALRKFLAEN